MYVMHYNALLYVVMCNNTLSILRYIIVHVEQAKKATILSDI